MCGDGQERITTDGACVEMCEEDEVRYADGTCNATTVCPVTPADPIFPTDWTVAGVSSLTGYKSLAGYYDDATADEIKMPNGDNVTTVKACHDAAKMMGYEAIGFRSNTSDDEAMQNTCFGYETTYSDATFVDDDTYWSACTDPRNDLSNNCVAATTTTESYMSEFRKPQRPQRPQKNVPVGFSM